jgi:hypothetical protein
MPEIVTFNMFAENYSLLLLLLLDPWYLGHFLVCPQPLPHFISLACAVIFPSVLPPFCDEKWDIPSPSPPCWRRR